MNKGIARSRGRYLYFLGAGDRLRPGILDRLAPQMPDAPNSFVYGNVWWCHRQIVHDGPFTPLKLIRGCITHQAVFTHRTLYDAFGLYEVRYKIAADYAKNLAFFGSPKVNRVFIDCIVADYEGGGLSDTFDDVAFKRDRPRLFFQRLGPLVWLAYGVERLMPQWLKDLRMQVAQRARRLVGSRRSAPPPQ
jgi:hypothetical protein